MYKIYADDTLIYDSTIEDYKIAKGSITLETNKSGSFTFSLYPDHFYYDQFVRLKTVITVYKSNKIIFRGRILNDVSDYWNNKVITCEGELGFLQDSIIRPYKFSGSPRTFLERVIEFHNEQVDDFKKFKIGTITVEDANNYIARSNSAYESSLSNLNSRLLEDSLGGYLFVTHDKGGTDPIPTLNYLSDFDTISTQKIEFGSNLKDYSKTINAEEIATAIIPLGAELDTGDDSEEKVRLTIKAVNDGVDYVYDPEAVALYGWIFKTVQWDDVTEAKNLKAKAEAYLKDSIKQNITIELNAIDLHLLDKSIQSFKVGDYIHVISKPHNFDSVLLCAKQTIDLLKPDNDTITLGHTYSTFTEGSAKSSANASNANNNVNNLLQRINSVVDPSAKLSAVLANSLGLFTTVATDVTGAKEYILHNAPKLEDSLIIWKMTSNAFVVSNDGGQTWRAGITSEGEAVVNLLSAVGIVANWIKAGIITDHTSKSYWDLDNGEFHLNGIFTQEDKNGTKSVDILNNCMNFYDWENNGNYLGSVGSIYRTSNNQKGIGIYSGKGEHVTIGCKPLGDDGQIYNAFRVDDTVYNNKATPWIVNTATGTLLGNNPNGGIVVENGLIKSWSLKGVNGTQKFMINSSGSYLNLTFQDGLLVDIDGPYSG